ncbi:MAG: MarR family transcriptional regulator [Brucellaceae bacterium]|nr:MarR family transcriptional regulator [Brucellaceae bacterium]
MPPNASRLRLKGNATVGWPQVTAPLAEAETGASRAAVQRNIDKLAERGLIREVTGQGRYRVWMIAV